MKPKILAFAGSTREESFNRKLIKIAAASAKAAGADVTCLDLRDFPLPIFNQDLEVKEGIPPNGIKLREIFLAHQGLLISSPEYNSSVTPLLKNTIDWVSRPFQKEVSLACFVNKVAGLMSASPGALGGLRSLAHLRSILGNIKVLVLPDQVAVPKAQEAFNVDGSLKDRQLQASIEKIAVALTKVLIKLNVS